MLRDNFNATISLAQDARVLEKLNHAGIPKSKVKRDMDEIKTINETEAPLFETKSVFFLQVQDDFKGVKGDIVVIPFEFSLSFYAGTKVQNTTENKF